MPFYFSDTEIPGVIGAQPVVFKDEWGISLINAVTG